MASSEVVVVEENGVEITAAVGGETASTCEGASGAEHGGAADEEGEVPAEGRSRRGDRAVLQDGVAKQSTNADSHKFNSGAVDNIEDIGNAADGRGSAAKGSPIPVCWVELISSRGHGLSPRVSASSTAHISSSPDNVARSIRPDLSND